MVGGCDFEAVLDDRDAAEGFREMVCGWLVGAEHLAFHEHAEVSLGVEKLEEVLGFRFRRDRDREGDEDVLTGEVLRCPCGGGFG